MAQTEREALVALYNATGGAYWKNNINWNKCDDLSQWHGVKIKNDRVVELELSSNNLRAMCAKESRIVYYLTAGSMRKGLKFEMSAGFDGRIPPSLGNLHVLEKLSLWGNDLTGAIPKELGALSKLQILYLHRNQLRGSIPKELGALKMLERFWLHRNHLAGPIPPELGNMRAVQYLYLSSNQLGGSIPKTFGNLRALTHLDLSRNNRLIDAPNRLLTGGSLMRWQEKTRDARRKEPWATSLVDFLVFLWHFLLPVIDDVTDVILLSATSRDRGMLWRACCTAFVLAHIERVLVLLITLLLVLCWVPFALLGTDESRGKRFKRVFKVLNGSHDLNLESVFVRNDHSGVVWGNAPSALRWPILDGFMWAVVGSRSKSSSLMSLCGMAGNTAVVVLEQSGGGLSLIDRIVHFHPYRFLGTALFSCPYRHHLPDSDTTTRRSEVMLRAVGETLVVDSLFFALSVSTETWEDGASIGVYSLIFSVLELLTELQYYAAEARANMVTDEEERMDAERAYLDSFLESENHAPSA